jgi:hypothetical protein
LNRIQRLAAVVAELKSKRLAAGAVPLAVAELERAGFRVPSAWADGLAVDEAPGLHEKLAELRGRGIDPTDVFIIRKLEDERCDGERDSDPTSPRRTPNG